MEVIVNIIIVGFYLIALLGSIFIIHKIIPIFILICNVIFQFIKKLFLKIKKQILVIFKVPDKIPVFAANSFSVLKNVLVFNQAAAQSVQTKIPATDYEIISGSTAVFSGVGEFVIVETEPWNHLTDIISSGKVAKTQVINSSGYYLISHNINPILP